MRRRGWIVTAAVAAAVVPVIGGRAPATTVGIAARDSNVDRGIETRSYPAFNADGSPAGSATWRVVTGVGDCCENYLGMTAGGRLLDLGGATINYSDDRGQTWHEVSPSIFGFLGAEGGIVSAPNGDIVGATWDPYSGDRVVSYKYVAAEDKWYYLDGQLHTPFSDRPWISLIPGPFTIGAVTVPYISVFSGGVGKNELHYYSLDGLTYSLPDVAFGEVLTSVPTQRWLDLPPDPAVDYEQPQTNSWITPLAGGGALMYGLPGANHCGWRILDSLRRWSCFTFPDGSKPTTEAVMQTDSHGRLHEVSWADSNALQYRISSDGGRSWQTTRLVLPDEAIVYNFDFKASGAANVSAVAVHVALPLRGVNGDYVFAVSTATGAPVVQKMYQLGNLDRSFGGFFTVNGGPRFDFTSVEVFPDGKIAASFGDGSHPVPALAIQP